LLKQDATLGYQRYDLCFGSCRGADKVNLFRRLSELKTSDAFVVVAVV